MNLIKYPSEGAVNAAMTADEPAPQEAVKAFLDFLGNDVIVGYNVRFDIEFIREDIKQYFGQEMNFSRNKKI